MLTALNESVFMYQTGTVESLLNLKYWSIGLVIVPLVLLTVVVLVLVRPTVLHESCTHTLAFYSVCLYLNRMASYALGPCRY
jgi:hypothetical protein